MATPIIQPSFAAGELSPTLYGRVDLAKYKIGAALLRNFFVDYRGGASNRAGTRYVGRALYDTKNTRLIPFKFSTLQTYVLEFGDLYMRVIKDGAYVLESNKTITSITQANPGVVTSAAHGFANGDWVYFATSGMSKLNQKILVVTGVTTNTFTLATVDGVVVDTTAYTAFVSGTVARVYTITTPYVHTDLALLKYTQSADKMTLTHPSYQARDLTRTGHAAWTLSLISFYTSITPPASVSIASSSAGSTWYSYVITAVNEGGEESIASNRATISAVNISATAGTITTTWTPVAGAKYYNIYRAALSNSDVAVGATHGYVGMTYGVQFQDSNITPDYTKTPPTHSNPFARSTIQKITLSAGGTAYVASTTTCTITDPNGTGAVLLPVVVSGAVVAVIVLDGGQGYTSPTVVFGGAGSGAAATATVGPSTGTDPGVAAYFQQRKMFAASANFPQSLWGTKPGAYTNMDKSIPTVDDDALNLTLYSTQVNDIKFMLAMPGGLVVLTGGGAWQVSGSSGNNSPVTPTGATAVPQAYNGCADLPPIIVNYDILYVQSKGSIVRDLSYNFFTNIYTGQDVSIMSNHLFSPRKLVEWAYAEEPYKIVWCVRDDGRLLSMTFIKEQEVMGWAQHSTQGQFKSIAVIQEGLEDVPYFVVKRYVGGKWVQLIEKMASRVQPLDVNENISAEAAWFVDCGLDYPMVYPSAGLTLSAATGTIIVTADASVFSAGDVGKVLRAGGGKGTVTGYTSGTQVQVKITDAVVQTIPDDPSATPLPVATGAWTLVTPVTTVTGLDHLEGKTVKVLADGSVCPDQVVSGGSISLPHSASRIVVGLGYTAQLKTLYLDVGEPTIQGRRKRIVAMTARVSQSRGLKFGADFNTLFEWKGVRPTAYGKAIPLHTGDERVNVVNGYGNGGQVCLQQDYPLPASVLAVIPEVEAGDTK